MHSNQRGSSIDSSFALTPTGGDRSSSVTYFLPNAQATHDLGVLLGRSLPAGANLLLYGNLGSGKTTFVQGLGQGLGITDPIVSPTFTLINEYLEGRIPLYHFDLYRLTQAATTLLTPEMYWEGMDYDPGIVVIEWAERLEFEPPQCLKVEFAFTPKAPTVEHEPDREPDHALETTPESMARSVTLSIADPDQPHPELMAVLSSL